MASSWELATSYSLTRVRGAGALVDRVIGGRHNIGDCVGGAIFVLDGPSHRDNPLLVTGHPFLKFSLAA